MSTLRRWLIAYATALVVFTLVDGTWIALVVIKGFTAFVAVTDIAWGMALGAIVTFLSALLLRRFGVLKPSEPAPLG